MSVQSNEMVRRGCGKILARCRIGLPPFVEKVESDRRGHPAEEET